MPATTIEQESRINNQARWLIVGHTSANVKSVAMNFLGPIETLELTEETNDLPALLTPIDAAALVINAKTGVSKSMIQFWQYLAERQFPRMVIVNGLEFSETDFDDMVLIATRVLEQVATPFLVLHDEVGEPTGLISLHDLIIHDYSQPELRTYPADEELIGLVSDFREEYEEQLSEFGAEGFSEGLFVPALPLGGNRKFGISEIQKYIDLITRH